MPIIKELEELLPFVADMEEKYQHKAAKDLRRWIVFDEEAKTMTWQERGKLFLMDYHKRTARK